MPNQRAGIEGTISQGVRRSALRQSRYIGLAKTRLQHILMAVGLNLCRLDAWLNGISFATTRYSGFMTLKPKNSYFFALTFISLQVLLGIKP